MQLRVLLSLDLSGNPLPFLLSVACRPSQSFLWEFVAINLLSSTLLPPPSLSFATELGLTKADTLVCILYSLWPPPLLVSIDSFS